MHLFYGRRDTVYAVHVGKCLSDETLVEEVFNNSPNTWSGSVGVRVCCVVLCCVVLCCVVCFLYCVCCGVLCCVVLCCDVMNVVLVLFCAVLCCVFFVLCVLCCVVL